MLGDLKPFFQLDQQVDMNLYRNPPTLRHQPRSHQTFRPILAVKLLGVMFKYRHWPTTFHTITAIDANGWCLNWPVWSIPQPVWNHLDALSVPWTFWLFKLWKDYHFCSFRSKLVHGNQSNLLRKQSAPTKFCPRTSNIKGVWHPLILWWILMTLAIFPFLDSHMSHLISSSNKYQDKLA